MEQAHVLKFGLVTLLACVLVAGHGIVRYRLHFAHRPSDRARTDSSGATQTRWPAQLGSCIPQASLPRFDITGQEADSELRDGRSGLDLHNLLLRRS